MIDSFLMLKMRKKDVISCSVVAVMILVIIFLSILNDNNFKEERESEKRKSEKQDSISFEQIKGLKIGLDEMAIQMDSVKAAQVINGETENRHYEQTTISLDQIKRSQRQLLNEMK